MAEKATKAKSGTASAKVETVIGTGAKALTKAVSEAQKTLAALTDAGAVAEEITQEIAVKTSELANLTTEFEEAKRKGMVDIAMSLLENEEQAIATCLAKTGKIAVLQSEYDATTAECTRLKTDFQTEVNKEVGKAKAIAEAKALQDIKVALSDAGVANAQQAANLVAAKEQITFYQTQNASLLKQLDAERTARVDEAKARGNAVVNVATGK